MPEKIKDIKHEIKVPEHDLQFLRRVKSALEKLSVYSRGVCCLGSTIPIWDEDDEFVLRMVNREILKIEMVERRETY